MVEPIRHSSSVAECFGLSRFESRKGSEVLEDGWHFGGIVGVGQACAKPRAAAFVGPQRCRGRY